MKHGGLSRWGPLLAVLTLLVSAGVLVPLGAQATGERIWGYVWSDCGTANPVLVPSSVTLLDVHSGTTQSYPANSGYYEFVSPGTPPGYYKVKVDPIGFGYFGNETPPFRFDGLSYPRQDVCVDRIPAKIRYLNLTILDAQPGRVTNERVVFQQFTHLSENATLTYNPGDNTITVSAFPLVNRTETITWFNNTGLTPVTGRILTYGLHYIYDPTLAFQGKIKILDTTLQSELRNAIFGKCCLPDRVGWLKVTYQSASTLSRLAHAQVTNEVWKKDTLVMADSTGTLNFTRATGAVQIVGNWSFGDDVLDASYDWSGAITTAHVTVRDPAHNEAIEPELGTTTPPGVASAQVYDGTFRVQVTATDYSPVVRIYTISGSDFADTIYMTRALTVTVLALDAKGPVSSGITALLINTNPGLDDHVRIMRSTSSPQGNILTIPAYAGTWLLIVDANGYKAGTRMLTLTGNYTVSDLYLTQSGEEKYQTGVVFPGNDWNSPVVWRNLSLLPDSELPAIGSENLRNLTWQVDFAFGTVKDGALTALEKTALTSFLGKAGPFYTVTDNFLTVNGKTYRSSGVATDYTVSGAWSLQGGLSIVTSEKYALSDTSKPIPLNAARYYVNVTTAADKNVTVYQNNTVIVTLPHGYEMISKTSTGNVATRNFTVVTVDPGIDAVIPNPRVNMVVEKSVTGVARAEVEGPAGKVSVRQADFTKYKAWVANNTVIVFSANKTTDRQNQAINVKDANFTWTFKQKNVTFVNTSYGIWTKNNFTNVGDWYIVNLTVRQVNPDNRTYREINVTVDNVAPIPWIRTNRTGNALNPPSLSVKEDLSTRFFGNASADDLYAGSPDKGAVADWAWDFDGDGTIDRRGSIIDWNYSTPGTYNTTLIVTDSVGHKSRNRTIAVTVTDVTPPSVNYVVLDPANDYRETAQLIEGHAYIFNASKTTDNSLKHAWDNVNLTYTFQWGDGSTDGPSTGSNASLNVTHRYAKFSNGYKLNITVMDLAGNKGYLNRSLVVQANTTAHPDLSVIVGTLKVDPGNPEEGATVHFSLNFTNAKGKANTTKLNVLLSMVVSGKDTNQTIADVRFTDANGNPLNAGNPLIAGKNGTVSFTWTAPTVGNKSLTIKVWDDDEPTTWVTAANQQTTSLVVKEAGWKLYAIVGGGIFIVFGLPILYYVIRKVRAGEWSLRRRKREEDEEEEEEEEEEDEEERGGKKRL